MMKSNIFRLFGIGLTVAALASCSESFLDDKKDSDNFGPEIYNNLDGATLRVNSVYGECLPNPSAAAGWNNNCTGIYSDIQSKATEEYCGISSSSETSFVNPQYEMDAITGNRVPDYFQNEQKHLSNVWGRIRNINDVAVNGQSLGLGGYLDIGLYDTMEDLFVNFIGAVVFSLFGYFYVKHEGSGKLVSSLVPRVAKGEDEE